jgi:hypothetical protein
LETLRPFGDLLYEGRPDRRRLRLIIETWIAPSYRVAEACGHRREGALGKAG